MSGAVASRYARAIFELGRESGNAAALLADVQRAATAFESSDELREALDSPLFPPQAKHAIVKEISERLTLGELARNALLLLSDRRRLGHLPAIAQRLRELADADLGTVHAEVTTATPLSEAFFERLQSQLEKLTGKKVTLAVRHDPALLGGVVTRIGDTVFDGSLRARLDTLTNALMPN